MLFLMNRLMIVRTPVRSSCIAFIGYDEAARTLEIEFHSGAVYRYFGVVREIHMDLVNAPSKGAYLNRHIKGRHPERRQQILRVLNGTPAPRSGGTDAATGGHGDTDSDR